MARRWQRVTQAADTDRPQPTMSLPVGGAVLTLQYAKLPCPERRHNKRGKVTGFSGAARARLMKKLASINRAAVSDLPLFVTLTYPAVWSPNPRDWKRHLDNFLKALARKAPNSSAIWKLEFQKRGAPHFHILLFGLPYLAARWVAATWYRVVGSGDRLHLKAGTEVRRCKTWNHVTSYAAKYVAKVTDETGVDFPGRFWGVFQADNLPIEVIVVPITFGQFFRLRRLLYKARQAKRATLHLPGSGQGKDPRCRPRSEYQGCSLYCSPGSVMRWAAYIAESEPCST